LKKIKIQRILFPPIHGRLEELDARVESGALSVIQFGIVINLAEIDVEEQMARLVSLFEGGSIFSERSGNRTSNHVVIHYSNRELEGRAVFEGHDVKFLNGLEELRGSRFFESPSSIVKAKSRKNGNDKDPNW
jgi:hypothetical protein